MPDDTHGQLHDELMAKLHEVEAERDRYKSALHEIEANSDHPWAAGVAESALYPDSDPMNMKR